jgi:phage tail tube protein FII
MTPLDKRLQPTALKLLNKYGKALTYVQTTEGAYNPETSEIDTTSITYNIKGLLSEVSVGDITRGSASSVSVNKPITGLDVKITISGLSIDNPINGDVINGKYFVKYVNPVYSGELVAYYELICESR